MEIESEQQSIFVEGEMVKIKSKLDVIGIIHKVQINKEENKYKVFTVEGISEFYESQLLKIEEKEITRSIVSLSIFNAHISSLQILNPNISTLYSLNSAFIDFVPYQYRPVLKIINADRPRILIADEVGIGKTIEAGLILRELQARQDIKSVLVICPKPLVTEKKWYNELKRFNEDFVHLDTKGLQFCLHELDFDGVWPERYSKAIVPYSIFNEDLLEGQLKPKKRVGLLNLDPPPTFDLIIVDEAHRIRNNETFAYKVVSFLCEHAEAVVFLTATPIQLGENDLFTLLNVIRPDYIIDQSTYQSIAEPNKNINSAVQIIRTENDSWQIQALTELEIV